MLFQNRDEARDYFFQVWGKHKNKLPLEPIEIIISDVILAHPEYHHYLDDKERFATNDFKLEQNKTNPFLHMSMHIALKEQVNSNRPNDISQVFKQLMTKSTSVHDAEHKMMACLEQSLWEAQRNNTLPNENTYLACLKKIL